MPPPPAAVDRHDRITFDTASDNAILEMTPIQPIASSSLSSKRTKQQNNTSNSKRRVADSSLTTSIQIVEPIVVDSTNVPQQQKTVHANQKAVKPAAATTTPHAAPPAPLPPLPSPYRICLVGSSKVGKTQLLNRFLTGCYERYYNPTNDIEIGRKLMTNQQTGFSYAVEIWDIPSTSPKIESQLRDHYLSQMDGAIIVTDSTDLKSFQCLRKWSDLFGEVQLKRLGENMEVLQREVDEQRKRRGEKGDDVNQQDDTSTLHCLPQFLPAATSSSSTSTTSTPQKHHLVSTFPVLLFSNKSDSDRASLSLQDILESSSHFKLNFGVLGSVLTDKPLNEKKVMEGLETSGLSEVISSTLPIIKSLHPADGGVQHVFQLLLHEILRYNYLRSITALKHVKSTTGPDGCDIVKPLSSQVTSTTTLHNQAEKHNDLSLRSHAQVQPAGVGLAFSATTRGSEIGMIGGMLASKKLEESHMSGGGGAGGGAIGASSASAAVPTTATGGGLLLNANAPISSPTNKTTSLQSKTTKQNSSPIQPTSRIVAQIKTQAETDLLLAAMKKLEAKKALAKKVKKEEDGGGDGGDGSSSDSDSDDSSDEDSSEDDEDESEDDGAGEDIIEADEDDSEAEMKQEEKNKAMRNA